MQQYYSSKDLEGKLIDIHNGLHIAMDNLINKKNYKETEVILRQIDEVLSRTINQNKVLKNR